jgi:hypothetical protein
VLDPEVEGGRLAPGPQLVGDLLEVEPVPPLRAEGLHDRPGRADQLSVEVAQASRRLEMICSAVHGLLGICSFLESVPVPLKRWTSPREGVHWSREGRPSGVTLR